MDSDEETAEETKGPKFPIQMYVSEGNKYLRLKKYDKAIEFFNTALEKEPSNESSLVGRAKCHMQLGNLEEAKEDALAVLEAHPRSSDAKMLIGEIDYFLGDFEKAFLTLYRGHQARENHERLKLGHQMCRKAIDNALQPDKPIIIDKQDLKNLSRLESRLDKDQPVELRIGKGQYRHDADFINNLLEDDPDESIRPHCEFLKSYVESREVFWKTQNPSTAKEDKKSAKEMKDVVDNDLDESPEEEEPLGVTKNDEKCDKEGISDSEGTKTDKIHEEDQKRTIEKVEESKRKVKEENTTENSEESGMTAKEEKTTENNEEDLESKKRMENE